MGLLAALPTQKLSQALYSGSTSIGLLTKLRTAIRSLGHLDVVTDLYRTKQLAEDIITHYEAYPSGPDAFADWQTERDDLLDRVYETTGASPKY
jgi:hypothetical protein